MLFEVVVVCLFVCLFLGGSVFVFCVLIFVSKRSLNLFFGPIEQERGRGRERYNIYIYIYT